MQSGLSPVPDPSGQRPSELSELKFPSQRLNSKQYDLKQLLSELSAPQTILTKQAGYSDKLDLKHTRLLLSQSRTQLERDLNLTGRSDLIPRWLSGFFLTNPSERLYSRAYQSAYDALQKRFTGESRRALKACAGELTLVTILDDLKTQLTLKSPGAEKLQQELRAGLARTNVIKWINRGVTYPLLAVVTIPIGVQAVEHLNTVGVLPDPIRYLRRDQDGVIADALSELKNKHGVEAPKWLQDLKIEDLQREMLKNIGLTDQEIELHIRRDDLNHLGFSPPSLGALVPNAELYTVNGSYERLFDALQLNSSTLNRGTLLHELCHRNGYFSEVSLRERLTQAGPHTEIEEGICNLAGRKLRAVEEYQNAFNAALLAMLLGMPEEGIQTPLEAQQAYETGLRELGLAMVVDKSFGRIERNLTLRYGKDAYDRICNESFEHSNGATWMMMELLATLEENGAKVDKIFQTFEVNLQSSAAFGVDSEALRRVTQVLLNSLYLDDDRENLKLTKDLLAAYPDHPCTNALHWYSAQMLGMSGGDSQQAYQHIKAAANSTRHDPWWAHSVIQYTPYAYGKQEISKQKAVEQLDQVVKSFPNSSLGERAKWAKESLSHNRQANFMLVDN